MTKPSRKTETEEGVRLAQSLYTLADINGDIRNLVPDRRRPVLERDDIGLVDDVIDALVDARQAPHARAILRDALALIARRALSDARLSDDGPES